ncbi:MAG: HTH domain-containing protein [Christensenellales bacterium]
MANRKFTPQEIALLKASPYVMEVTEDIIHFSALFKSSFWDRLQNGMKPPDIFRDLGIDPSILGPTRVAGFKGMLKQEVLAGKGFRDLNTCKEYYAKNMTAAQRIAYLEQQLEYKDQEIEFLKKIVSLHRGGKG